MNILWITNIMLPPVCKELKISIPPIGGWMYSMLKSQLHSPNDYQIAIATVWEGDFRHIIIDGITYYLLPLNGKSKIKYNRELENYWKRIKDSFNPDIIHIHGSEFPHGLSYVNACGAKSVVVSVQGIISSIVEYYTSGINDSEIRRCLTLRDVLKGGILSEKTKFAKRGKLEIELLSKVNHIIGRTEWDKAHIWAINPQAKYYHVGENLRDSFYKYKWKYENCEPYTIFVSQASYPIKGLHKLLKALPLVIKRYPRTKLYVAGNDIINRPWYKINSYGNYLKRIIKESKLEDRVCFTGSLNEQQMCQQYLKSNLFICCSSIENSPNSLGEAQLLGMPHLATYVGGIPEIVENNPEVLYRFEEIEMLAHKICNIFQLKGNFAPTYFDESMYDRNLNANALNSAYHQIYNS